jgi:hypothetical protein
MAVRTGNWGPQGIFLSFHAPVEIELAPPDAPDTLVRIVEGAPSVDRALTVDRVSHLVVNDAKGAPRLELWPTRGVVERHDGPAPTRDWGLLVEAGPEERIHLYARPGTPFPSDDVLARLAAAVPAPTA